MGNVIASVSEAIFMALGLLRHLVPRNDNSFMNAY
jgi:hypothetical protein